MKNGFTLVELSIVLVIIGLLTGGILVAQSLIDTAKLSRLIRDLGQYEIAIKMFKDKFKSYPGDSIHFGVPGDNDGTVDNSSNCTDPFSEDEKRQFWADLSDAKMISTKYVGWQPSNPCNGTHADDSLDPSLAGVVWPAREHNSETADIMGRTITPFIPILNSRNHNLSLTLLTNALETVSIESKLGTQSSSGSNKEVGVVNTQGAGLCIVESPPRDASVVRASCGDPTAVYGTIRYYIAK